MTLTISIPTYNRADTLPVLLDSILAQVTGLDIRILISDNASTDSTQKLVASYASRYKGMFDYFRNESNLGYSCNVDLAVSRAQTEFVLLMSDDDALEDGVLPRLMEVLRSHESDASLVFSSAIAYNADLARPEGSNQEVLAAFFPDGRNYIRSICAYPPALLSGYVVKRDDWLENGFHSLHRKSIIVHMLVAMEMCLSGCGVVVSGLKLVKYRQANPNSTATWSSQPLYPFRFFLDCLQGRKDAYNRMPKDIRRLLYSAAMRTIVLYLARQKVLRHPFDAEAFWGWFGCVSEAQSVYTLLAYIVRFTPRCVLKLLLGWFINKYPI
ncbi:MAG: glycosyltransferase family 2 protein [Kiritimatiellae bacterium]|nr:glycosyltransferase family 2 protein [Kiritimatiellia bacterium]MBQ6139780.1 glycosyltransferase family 2 protein [Kiritimatiellia bacterium]